MKKTMKIIATALMFVMVVSLSVNVFATVADIDVNPDTTAGEAVGTVGKQVLGIIKVIGVFASVGILMIVGIKYMMGSAEEKAEYKKVMIPYVIGAILLFAATTIVPKLVDVANNLAK